MVCVFFSKICFLKVVSSLMNYVSTLHFNSSSFIQEVMITAAHLSVCKAVQWQVKFTMCICIFLSQTLPCFWLRKIQHIDPCSCFIAHYGGAFHLGTCSANPCFERKLFSKLHFKYHRYWLIWSLIFDCNQHGDALNLMFGSMEIHAWSLTIDIIIVVEIWEAMLWSVSIKLYFLQ